MSPYFPPSPQLLLSVPCSGCHGRSFAGWREASEGMSKRHLRQACEGHGVISVERAVSFRGLSLVISWNMADNAWCREERRTRANPQRQDEEVRSVGSTLALLLLSNHSQCAFVLLMRPLLNCCVEPHPAWSFLTGPSCMRTLAPTALFDFVFISLSSWRLSGLIFVAALSDLCCLYARSMPTACKWQRLMRATSPATTVNMFLQTASWWRPSGRLTLQHYSTVNRKQSLK